MSDIKKLTNDLKSEMKNLRSSLLKFENNVSLIQDGDGKKPYWNGANAYQCVDKSLTQIDYDYNLLENLEKCVEFLEKTEK